MITNGHRNAFRRKIVRWFRCFTAVGAVISRYTQVPAQDHDQYYRDVATITSWGLTEASQMAQAELLLCCPYRAEGSRPQLSGC